MLLNFVEELYLCLEFLLLMEFQLLLDPVKSVRRKREVAFLLFQEERK